MNITLAQMREDWREWFGRWDWLSADAPSVRNAEAVADCRRELRYIAYAIIQRKERIRRENESIWYYDEMANDARARLRELEGV